MANRKMYYKPNSSTNDRGNSESSSARGTINAFANDGSFLEMFKKKMEEKSGNSDVPKLMDSKPKSDDAIESAPISDIASSSVSKYQDGDGPSVQVSQKKSSILSLVGKRRGGKVLPTGMVKKAKKSEDDEFQGFLKKNDRKPEASDAWSQYMAEVKRYKERSCEDEGKTRPLVK